MRKGIRWTHKDTITDLSIILLLGLLSITWFKGNFIIKSDDSFFGLAPSDDLYRGSFVWEHVLSTGLPYYTFALSQIPYKFFMTFLETIGIPLVISQKILYYSLFTSSGLFMYFLSSTLADQRHRRIVKLASAFFYMMNPFYLSQWGWNYTTFMFLYPLFPITVTLFIKGLNTEKKFRYLLLTWIVWFVFSPAVSDPPHIIVIWLTMFLYLAFYVLLRRGYRSDIVNAFKFTSILVLSLLLLNTWWILPAVYFMGHTYEAATAPYSSLEVFLVGSQYSTTLNNFRLLGYYPIYVKWYPDPNYLWTETYLTLPFITLSFLIPFLAYCSVFLERRDSHVLFFLALSVIGLFLTNGASPPLGVVNLWFFTHLPFGMAFRVHYEKFGSLVALSYAFLIGISIDELYRRMKSWFDISLSKRLRSFNHSKTIRHAPAIFTLSLFIVLYVVYPFPFWTGAVIYSGGQYIPSQRIQVPVYYYEAGDWINSQTEEFKILSLPPPLRGTSAYTWEHGYAGSDFLTEYYLLNRPTLGQKWSPSAANDHVEQIIELLLERKPASSIGKILGLLNVKYILVHRDWDSKYVRGVPPSEYFTEVLETQEDVHPAMTFGELDFYENHYWMPFIYTTDNATYIQGDFTPESLTFLINDVNFSMPVFFYSGDNQGRNATILNVAKAITIYTEYTSKRAAYVILAPKIGIYDIYADIRWNHKNATICYRIDDGVWSVVQLTSDINFTKYSTVKLGSESLTAGWHTISIEIPHDTLPTAGSLSLHPMQKQTLNAKAPANIMFQRVNPTKYAIHVNASNPFFLVFSESYHKDWIAYVDGQRVPSEFHFMANGYANAWYINKTGIYTITLEFWPQRLFYLGATISIVTFTVCVVYLVKNHVKRRPD